MQYQSCKLHRRVYNVAIMKNFEGILTPRIISFQEQPLFPYEDLSEDNTAYLTQHFKHAPASKVMADELFDAQLGLYQVAIATRLTSEVYCEDSQVGYEASSAALQLSAR